MNYSFEEDNCLACHKGNVSGTNIEAELKKPFKHAVGKYNKKHDPAENFSLGEIKKHVECSDCHNPHWTNKNVSGGAPGVSGANSGVSGINALGEQIKSAANEYEICFKCHAGNSVLKTMTINRQIEQLNTRLEFDPSNPSFHPVMARGINRDVPSLLPDYTTDSIIYCSDCHNNDDEDGPKGPHASNNKFLLERNYTIEDYTKEDPYEYDLCYKCHDRMSILNNESFTSHSKHIVDEETPCSVCHDAHGISSTQGESSANSHLINFDLEVVSPDSLERLNFEDLGTFTGKCSLTCHGVIHEETQYP